MALLATNNWQLTTPHGFTSNRPPLNFPFLRCDRTSHPGGFSGSGELVHQKRLVKPTRRFLLIPAVLLFLLAPYATQAQTRPAGDPNAKVLAEFRGRTIEEVRVTGNATQSTTVIMNMVRTREGDPFDPQAVEEDYQRIYTLKKFANVEARVEPTARGGVIVTYVVSETRQIKLVSFVGNREISTLDLQQAADIKRDEAIDRFRISVAKQSIETLYKEKNYPHARVDVDQDALAKNGELVFRITEGPQVKVRKVDFKGVQSFSKDKLKDQIKTSSWIWIFRPGTYSPDQVDEDVAALRRFYQSKGFFDVRVGRKIIVSPDMTEVQVNFIVEEGVRYVIDSITFKGNLKVTEADLRKNLKLIEGKPYDNEVLQRDVREIVRAYSPYGFIYQPQSNNPEYLRIDTKNIFRKEPGKAELVYNISEGKSFRMGPIHIKGNTRTQDKVVLREMRVTPGQLYNSAELQDAIDRLRGGPFFTNVTITPIGDDPETRDVLVEVAEGRTANFGIGAGVNSNGGIGGNLSYEQRNFDITAWPSNFRDLFTDRAFTGAGQTFRVSLEPGTQATNASIRFTEPYIFDQPYSFSNELYLRDRQRLHYDDTRIGDRVSLGKRFNYIYTGQVALRAEDVRIHDVDDEPVRAPEIVDAKGHTTLTSASFTLRRNTTNPGILPYKGTNTSAGWESYGAIGGQVYMQKFTTSWDGYLTINEDLLDRRTIFRMSADAGYIAGNSVFFERFYGGGIGSVRGFRFRGVSPRDGIDEDAIGGDFTLTTTQEISFPIAGEQLRGVIFSDQGTVERDFEILDYRVSVGAGIRLVLPFLGQAPLSLDFGVPLVKNDQDDTQLISFSFGFGQ